jgi:hypothetical protein
MYNCDELAAYSATQQRQTFTDSKRVYYLSLEFLMGRTLDNAMLNLGTKALAKGRNGRRQTIHMTRNMPLTGLLQRALPNLASASKTSSSKNTMPPWVMVVLAVSLPASSTALPV